MKTLVSLRPITVSFPALSDLSAGQQLCPAMDLAVWAVRGVTLAALTWLWAVFVLRWDGGRGTAAAKMDLESVLQMCESRWGPVQTQLALGALFAQISIVQHEFIAKDSAPCALQTALSTYAHFHLFGDGTSSLPSAELTVTTGTPGTSQVLKTPGICPILHPHSLPTPVS